MSVINSADVFGFPSSNVLIINCLCVESSKSSGIVFLLLRLPPLMITGITSLSNIYVISSSGASRVSSAVIVSDTQNDIIPLYRQESLFTCANLVLDKAFNADIPIYYVMLSSLSGTPNWDLPSQLHYYDNGKIVDKDDVFDAFEGTILHKELLTKGISKVYVIGVSSMGCVLGTCRGSVKLKYELTLVEDAHDEPIGYRDESAIDQCNQIFLHENLGQLVVAENIVF